MRKKILLGIIPIMLFLYLVPILIKVDFSIIDIDFLLNNQDGFVSAISRSAYISFFQSLLIVIISILVAISLSNIEFHSFKGYSLSLLLVPILMGNVSTGFIWKILLNDHGFFLVGKINVFITLLIIQLWQYGTLFTYLFWLSIKGIPQKKWEYLKVSNLLDVEKIRDLVLPSLQNISTFLYILGFIFFFYEHTKIQFIFKASRGTETELITQWLSRIYQASNLISPDYAISQTSTIGLIILLFALISIFITTLLFSFLYSKAILKIRPINKFKLQSHGKPIVTSACYYILLGSTLFPIIILFFRQESKIDLGSLNYLFEPLILTFISSALATIISIKIGIFSRLVFRNILNNFNNKSMLLLIAVFVLLLIPPIIILLSGFKWMGIIGYKSKLMIYFTWVIGHVVLQLPLLIGFIIATHFKVENNKIEYLELNNSTLWEIVKDVFIHTMKRDYILTFIFAFSLIWNEATINNILSDLIPSFISELNKTIIGRGADYSKGINFLLVSLFTSTLCIVIWIKGLKVFKINK